MVLVWWEGTPIHSSCIRFDNMKKVDVPFQNKLTIGEYSKYILRFISKRFQKRFESLESDFNLSKNSINKYLIINVHDCN